MNLWVGGLLSPADADRYRDAIAMQLDHLLGRNIYDRTQVTGDRLSPAAADHRPPRPTVGSCRAASTTNPDADRTCPR